MNNTQPTFLIIDLFCGAGGTTTGFEMTNGLVEVLACVNHDKNAIRSHKANHPQCLHFVEDIRILDLTDLSLLVDRKRNQYPEAKLILWASLECTNFSKAKGGQPRDADSRTLADHLDRYILSLNPDYVQIENVVEFMSWGPLDDNGKPISRKNGQDWQAWRTRLCTYGYYDEWKELNSADFGAFTSRNRLFGCFAKYGLPISWPEPTHAKNPDKLTLYGTPLKKWNPVKLKLDFSDEGKSIFGRKKDLSDKTLDVIAKGLIKSIENKEEAFLFKYYGNGSNLNSINSPAGTITTKDRFALILRQYKTGYTTSVNEPLGTIPTTPKANLVSFIMNKSHGGHTTNVNNPCPVIIARQDKAPLYLIQAIMDQYGISDIKMRMLRVDELLSIQGFPDNYVLHGNQSEKKKYIGNSVVPQVVTAWASAMAEKLRNNKLFAA